MSEHAKVVLIEEIDPEHIEVEIAAWIDYYRRTYGEVKQVWCSPKDRPEAWECMTDDGKRWQVTPKGGCPHGHVYVM